MREVPTYFVNKLKDINSGLYCIWNAYFYKWQILHKNDRTGAVKRVRYLQTPNGEGLEFGDRRVDKILHEIKMGVPWDLLNKMDSTLEVLDHFDKQNKKLEDAKERERQERNQEIIKDTMREEKISVVMGA